MGPHSVYIAQYDYLPQRVDELALMKGDIVRLVEEVEDGWAKGEANGDIGYFPTNFVRLVAADKKSHHKSKREAVHYTPGGFEKYVEMIKNRPRRESTRRKPTRSFRQQKSKLKWGENSWTFFEPWRSFRFKDENQIKRSSGHWAGSLTSILRNASPDRNTKSLERSPTKMPSIDDRGRRKDKSGKRSSEGTHHGTDSKKTDANEKRYVSSVMHHPRSNSPEKRDVSPRRENDHFYNDDEFFKDGRVVNEFADPSPSLPKRPPVSAAMKMEELYEYYDEFDGESILEYYDEQQLEENSQVNETDSFYFYEDGEVQYESVDVSDGGALESYDDYIEKDEYSYYENDEEFAPQVDIQQKIEQQEQQLPARPQVHYHQRHEIYEEDDESNFYSDQGDDITLPDVRYKSQSTKSVQSERRILEPAGPRWTSGYIEGVVGKTPVKWGAPRYEEVEFPWNKPESKNPKTKGTGFKKNDHIHNLPTWVTNKGKPKRIIAPLPIPPKKPPSKPIRRQGETEVLPSNIGVQITTPEDQINGRPMGNPKVTKVVKAKKPGKVVLIRKNGKLYIPRHLKEQFLKERAQSDSTMKSISTVNTQQSPTSTINTKKSYKAKKVLDPSKPMSRADQIEFIKQQTKLAKKVALRPHIAESEVLAALHDLNDDPPVGRQPSKAAVPVDDDSLMKYPIYQLLPLSDQCRRLLVESELANPLVFYSQTLFSIGRFLQKHKDSLSVSDCNAVTASVIVARLVFSAVLKANECGVVSGETAKPNSLLSSENATIQAFKEDLPNGLSPPTKKDIQRLSLDTRKFLNERNISDLVKLSSISNQKQFRNALRKAMNAEEMPLGEQAKLELLFQSVSLEKLEDVSKKLSSDFKLMFNKPKGLQPKTLHLNKKEIDAIVAQQMLKCLQL